MGFYKLASSVNLYRFTHFLDFPFGTIFANLLVGEASPIPFEHHLPMMATRFSIVSKRTVEYNLPMAESAEVEKIKKVATIRTLWESADRGFLL